MSRPRHGRRAVALALALACALAGTLGAGCSILRPKPRAALVDLPDTAGLAAAARSSAAAAARRPAVTPKPATKPAAEPPTPSVAGARTGSSTSSPAVVPQLTPAEQERLEKETMAAVELAKKALDAVDTAKLDVEKNRKYVIAKDFLVQAGDARTRKEYERAQALALKARLLAEEIAPR